MADASCATPYDELRERLPAASGPAVSLTPLAPATEVGLRVDPVRAPGAVARLGEVLGLELPLDPNTVSVGPDGRALWLGPDEWLILAPRRGAAALVAALEAAAAGDHVTAVDLSANRVALELRGPRAGDALAHACSLDLRARSFPAGACAQTLVARVPAIVERVALGVFELRVRPSFSPYVVAWLTDAMEACR